LNGQTGNTIHPIYIIVYLPLDLLSSYSFIHEPEDLPVYPEYTGQLDTCKSPPTLPLTLIQYPFEEGLEGTVRDGLYYPDRILSYILIISIKRVRLAIREQKIVDKKRIRYPPIEISLDHIQEEKTTITIVLIFILRFVRVILLVEVILWRIGILLYSEPLQIWQVCIVISVDICINVRRLGLSVGLLLLIPCVKAALNV
jgi:hypothetical protein